MKYTPYRYWFSWLLIFGGFRGFGQSLRKFVSARHVILEKSAIVRQFGGISLHNPAFQCGICENKYPQNKVIFCHHENKYHRKLIPISWYAICKCIKIFKYKVKTYYWHSTVSENARFLRCRFCNAIWRKRFSFENFSTVYMDKRTLRSKIWRARTFETSWDFANWYVNCRIFEV